MSNLICPFCGEKIEHIEDGWCNCKNRCTGSGSIELWLQFLRTRKALEQSEICCTEWEKQALDYKAENIALSGDLERTRKALDVAVDALKLLNSEGKRTRILGLISITDTALGKIKTAL
jgi:hypothetical protein